MTLTELGFFILRIWIEMVSGGEVLGSVPCLVDKKQ